MTLRSALLLTWLLGLLACTPSPDHLTVTVEAGPYDRIGTLVAFALPNNVPSTVYVAERADGDQQIVQRDAQGRGGLRLDTLRAGTTATFTLTPASEAIATLGDPDIEHTAADGTHTLTVQRQPLLTYHAAARPRPAGVDAAYARGGYIYPLYSPKGVRLTEDYPASHPHQHSLWFAWTETAFREETPDFWNLIERTATVTAQGVTDAGSGLLRGGFTAHHVHVLLGTAPPETVLDETWHIEAFNTVRQGYHLFDLSVTQRNASPDTLLLKQYRYGGLGLRGRQEWSGPDSLTVLTSKGHDRQTGHGTRARWCYIGGLVEGQPVGLVVMSHPTNPRHPEPMRIHPDVPFFNFAPIQEAPLALAPGDTFAARYRIATLDGAPDAAHFDRLWADFAHPPAVSVQ